MFVALPLRWVSRMRDQGYFNQLLMAVMVTMPVANFGMLMGWLSPMTSILQSPDGPAPEPISDEVISWMGSANFLPLIFTSIFAGTVADRWGRKFVTMLTGLVLMVGWSIMLFSLRPWALILSRLIAGTAGAGCYVVLPMYLKEVASDNIRGALGSLFILSQNVGYLLVYVAGDLLSFTALLWLCTAVPALFLLGFIFMPETPVFLVKQGKIQQARAALSWLQNTTTDDKHLEEAIQQLQKEEEQAQSVAKASLKSLFQDKTKFKAFRIALCVMALQETCGYLVVVMFAGFIFEQASKSINLNLSPNKQTILVGVIQLVGSIVASCIVEQTGRKWLLAGTALVTGLSMLTLGVWFYITSMNIWLPGWLPVLALCLCIFADAAGFQPVPYVITSELFSFQYRGIVSSAVIVVCSLSDFIQTKTFDPLLKLLGIHWIFILFSSSCFLASFYAATCVPETKNKSVEEIYALLDGKIYENKEKNNPELGTQISHL